MMPVGPVTQGRYEPYVGDAFRQGGEEAAAYLRALLAGKQRLQQIQEEGAQTRQTDILKEQQLRERFDAAIPGLWGITHPGTPATPGTPGTPATPGDVLRETAPPTSGTPGTPGTPAVPGATMPPELRAPGAAIQLAPALAEQYKQQQEAQRVIEAERERQRLQYEYDQKLIQQFLGGGPGLSQTAPGGGIPNLNISGGKLSAGIHYPNQNDLDVAAEQVSNGQFRYFRQLTDQNMRAAAIKERDRMLGQKNVTNIHMAGEEKSKQAWTNPVSPKDLTNYFIPDENGWASDSQMVTGGVTSAKDLKEMGAIDVRTRGGAAKVAQTLEGVNLAKSHVAAMKQDLVDAYNARLIPKTEDGWTPALIAAFRNELQSGRYPALARMGAHAKGDLAVAMQFAPPGGGVRGGYSFLRYVNSANPLDLDSMRAISFEGGTAALDAWGELVEAKRRSLGLGPGGISGGVVTPQPYTPATPPGAQPSSEKIDFDFTKPRANR
jgi:hypothetical protein